VAELPFDDSRRLTGPNLHFPCPARCSRSLGLEPGAPLLEGWRARALRAVARLGWRAAGAPPTLDVRMHASGASLALTAPVDQLFTATEINEWALCATVLELDPQRWAGVEDALREAAAANEPPTPIPPVIAESPRSSASRGSRRSRPAPPSLR
jgi:hypothetical protein